MRAEVVWQPALLDAVATVVVAGPIQVDPSRVRRIMLDDRSWVDHCPGWLVGADEVFDELAGLARWQQRQVQMWDATVAEPRLTAGWSVGPDGLDPPPASVRAMADWLSGPYQVAFDRVWVNLYRDGADSVAWHGDRNRFVLTNPLVATVSLGARRTFHLRRRGSTRIGHTLRPGEGDLVMMGGACQHEWEHTVPKTARPVGARMSVTIRHSAPGPGQRRLAAPRSSAPGHLW